MKSSTTRIDSYRLNKRFLKAYRSAILAALILSITIIERLPRIHFCVKLIPIVEPGDFSISINNEPVACLTLSENRKYN
jgi:hypothetical protein